MPLSSAASKQAATLGRAMARSTWRAVRALGLAGLLLVAFGARAGAQVGDNPPPRDPRVEAAILEDLARHSADAVQAFAEGTAALDAGRLDEASARYLEVLAHVPRFPDALRRLSQVALRQGDVADARRYAFAAYGYRPAPANVAAVAEALLASEERGSELQALTYARVAARLLEADKDAQALYVKAAIDARDFGEVERACAGDRLEGDAQTGDGYVLYCSALSAASGGDWVEAVDLLEEAREIGVPDPDVDWALGNNIRVRARYQRRLLLVPWIMLTYAIGPLVFLAYGVGLGRMTMAVARRAARNGQLKHSLAERFLHSTYRGVILITSAYDYASVPFLWVALVAAWVGTFLQFYAGEPLWQRIAVIVGLIAVQYTLTTVYIGVTARVRRPDPGRPLARADAPGIWRIVTELAEVLQTRPIDAVFVIPDARINVLEEGRNRDLLRGRGRRILVLGLGLFPNMTVTHLRAIIAHEYAHFTNRDTAGGRIARQVHASMQRIAVQLTMVGQNKWYSPGWWYASGYSRIFLLVTMGASRLHEILADRTAASVCGVTDFTSALRHIVRQDHAFSAQVRAEMRLAKEESRPVRNLYALEAPTAGIEADEIEKRIAAAMERPSSIFDTHLSTAERIRLLEPLGAGEEAEHDDAPAWTLFDDPVGLQREMTDVVRATVRRREDRLLRAVAEAHDDERGPLRAWLRRATWFWRVDRGRDRDD